MRECSHPAFPPPPPASRWCLPWALLSWCDSTCSQNLLERWPELADGNWSEWRLSTASSWKTPRLGFWVVFSSTWNNLKFLFYICLLNCFDKQVGDKELWDAAFPAATSLVSLFEICIGPIGTTHSSERADYTHCLGHSPGLAEI